METKSLSGQSINQVACKRFARVSETRIRRLPSPLQRARRIDAPHEPHMLQAACHDALHAKAGAIAFAEHSASTTFTTRSLAIQQKRRMRAVHTR
jgi:hypothetical protein